MARHGKATKSGRTMNPADKQRKLDRLKEIKKNKKQRKEIRTAIIKNRDPEEIIEKLTRLDEQEAELALSGAPPRIAIAERRKKLRTDFYGLIKHCQTENDEDRVRQLQARLKDYEQNAIRKQQEFEAQKFSRTADPWSIPLPDGTSLPSAPFTPAGLPSYAMQPANLAAASQRGILKKPAPATAPPPPKIGPRIPTGNLPPGPPAGLAPLLTDEESGNEDDEDEDVENEEEEEGDEDVEDDEDEGATETTQRKSRVRFNDELDDHDAGAEDNGDGGFEDDGGDDLDDLAPVPVPIGLLDGSMGGIQGGPRAGGLIRIPPPPPPLAPMPPHLRPPPMGMPPGLNPMGFVMGGGPPGGGLIPPPPSLPFGGVRPNIGVHPSAVLSAAPQVNMEKRAAVEAEISAKPQLRELTKEAAAFVPVNVRVRRQEAKSKVPAPTHGGGVLIKSQPSSSSLPGTSSSKAQQQQQPAGSVDDAYAQFMNEMEGLL